VSHKIYNKLLLGKLGVRDDSIVSVVGVKDDEFWNKLVRRTTRVSRGRFRRDADLILFGAGNRKALSRLKNLKKYIKQNGCNLDCVEEGERGDAERNRRHRGGEGFRPRR